MVNDDRPDPDLLLAAITRQEPTKPGGKLHVFFGMSAGVGKTYAMLAAAQAKKSEGIDVVIGLVETHGRAETTALTAGLELIPRSDVTYRNVTLQEMDLDALLARKPQLAVVDELAHTNIPGSRHPKRWQDVEELLEAGIDVYTTLNVQHVESRKALVEAIGGIVVHETVPDALLERASSIELVDITPIDLLKRLSEGKVYLGERAESAAANFFKEDRLTALREMALRLTAEKVDSDLHGLLATAGAGGRLKSTDRLMVAVSHSPYSEGLVRATRRIAFGLGAPWLAVHVDTGVALSAEDRKSLAGNLQLVQELGGELVSTTDTDVAEALERVARQRGVTQMVVGRPTPRWRDHIWGGSILDRLARYHTGYDILVLRSESARKTGPSRSAPLWDGWFGWRPSAVACVTVIAVALLNLLLSPVIGYKAVGFLFLLSVLVVSLFVTFGAVTLAAVLSALLWDYFFIPPFGRLTIHQPEDVMMVCSYFAAALVTGTLAHRIRTRQRLIRQREERTQVLYELVRSLVSETDLEGAVNALSNKLRPLLQGEIDVIPTVARGVLSESSVLKREWLSSEKERAVAEWAHGHGTSAGWSTQTLPSSVARYLPLRTTSGTELGLLAFRPERDRRLTQDEENLLLAVAHQLTLSLERARLQRDAQEAKHLRESERLMQTVIDSVSHELRTPLTAIAGTTSALATDEIAAHAGRRRQLAGELLTMTERLNRVVGNLLDMSRLSSGTMTLKRDWHDPRDIISASLDLTQRAMTSHEVRLEFDDDLPLIWVDIQLMTQALTNILSNAAIYSAPETPVLVACRAANGRVVMSISDSGPGIPKDELPRIFAKFCRVPGARPGGIGLGLAITKVIVEAHGGAVVVANREVGGACFSIDLPLDVQPEIPDEDGET